MGAAGRAAQGCGCVSERQRIEPSREAARGLLEDVMTERRFGERERWRGLNRRKANAYRWDRGWGAY